MLELLSIPLILGYLIWFLRSQKNFLYKKVSGITGYYKQQLHKRKASGVNNSPIVTRPFDKTDKENFEKLFESIVKDVAECPEYADMPTTNKWLERVLNYNVPFGKKNRGLAVAETYRYLMQNSTSEENIRLSFILGWCVEILQACYLVADDIMDGSEVRRGRPAWYKVDGLGAAALNDSLFMESIVYFLLKKHFEHLPYYTQLVNEFHNVTHKTLYGQNLDTLTALDKNLNTYTVSHYDSIVKYKTSYYTFYLPVKVALIMAEIEDLSTMGQIKNILLKIGHYFQVQDDYLDCFGDPQVTGKVGTDIADTKCSWLYVKAMEVASPEQRQLLLDAYGSDRKDKVEVVTQLYRDLKLPELFKSYEDSTNKTLAANISLLSEEVPNAKLILQSMLSKLVSRQA